MSADMKLLGDHKAPLSVQGHVAVGIKRGNQWYFFSAEEYPCLEACWRYFRKHSHHIQAMLIVTNAGEGWRYQSTEYTLSTVSNMARHA